MATTTTGSVTIERSHFETLIRRANLVGSKPPGCTTLAGNADIKLENTEDDLTTSTLASQNLTIVSKIDYESLISIAHRFASLRQNLMNGGVSEEQIDLLSRDVQSACTTQDMSTYSTDYACNRDHNNEGGARLNPSTPPTFTLNPNTPMHQSSHNGHAAGNAGYGANLGGKPPHSQEWADADGMGDDFSASYSIGAQTADVTNQPVFNQFNQQGPSDRPYFARSCKRTVVLAGLPDSTTHLDVTKVVRGGLILEVYLRAAEHAALVSFLREEDAVRFFDHARKNDLYINHKRVFIKWADRHFHLAGHVAGKIAVGATRNMIIRRCDPSHTEDSIRDDLEHIHNLVVIKVEFLGGSCYIKTNSVHNAMFARTCMMSRIKYKGSKIEWDLDECEQPLEIVHKTATLLPQRAPSMKKPVRVQNRFASLRLDDDDDESDDKFDTSSDFPAASTVNVSA
ncbi:uncharacterized protein BCR38DRAFT_410443 [Pseudomassariella vexata]|uniref:RRM domain-containing protein n=1 Tax=Pseudomassariella vexata TaxID=1141098 RepID=A0A1Y2DWB3_9PEZI|nr:uncharacterized protein BCR38DRAFT_410443 [Pseudomassariella vexata]ORY63537.1 hypothetical protein BCR38DRAFT_410443 [Pseudomassariella vexata]